MGILLAGILGGIVMFIWTSTAHMALPPGQAGIDEIPNESAVLSAMQSGIGDKTGLYIFPGPVLIAGILAAMTTNVSYWNWYGFPGVYTASYIAIELVGFVLVGVVAALLLRRRKPAG
jgi:hypothetical protein